jgi:XRE family aerobic/anaerobic benzoate catabolism transcriptional regulator
MAEESTALPQKERAALGVLARVGARVRGERLQQGMTAKHLAERSGLSARFISQLEGGKGNIAIGRLEQVAQALNTPLESLVADPRVGDIKQAIYGVLRDRSPADLHRALTLLEQLFGDDRPRAVALLGLRGAGKSSVGPALATALGLRFVELDERIEAAAGLRLGEVFALHGEPYYRRLETRCLLELFSETEPCVVALSGGIVHNDEAFDLVRRHATSVWLKAAPEDHMSRVLDQGDSRPMANRRNAMAELRSILRNREPLYRQADVRVDTSTLSMSGVLEAVGAALGEHGWGLSR